MRLSLRDGLLMIFVLVFSALLTVGCSGGGGGGNNAQQSPAPNGALLQAWNNAGAGSWYIMGDDGSCAPNATVRIMDPDGTVVTLTANVGGAFNLSSAPGEFNLAVGSVYQVTQIVSGMTESIPVTVTMQAI